MKELQARYFDALYQVAETINSTLSVNEVLATIVKATAEATEAKGCSLMLLDDEKKRLIPTATYGLSDQYLHKGVVMADRSLVDALHGGPVIVPDVTDEQGFSTQRRRFKRA